MSSYSDVKRQIYGVKATQRYRALSVVPTLTANSSVFKRSRLKFMGLYRSLYCLCFRMVPCLVAWHLPDLYCVYLF